MQREWINVDARLHPYRPEAPEPDFASRLKLARFGTGSETIATELNYLCYKMLSSSETLASAAERLTRAPAHEKEQLVARYFLHLRDGSDELLDPEGFDYPTLEALRHAVLFAARDLLMADVRNGRLDLRFRIDAHDEAGTLVYSLPFKHALNIIPESDHTASLVAE